MTPFQKLFSFIFLFLSYGLVSQNYKPYHSYGVQLNINTSGLSTEQAGGDGLSKAGEDMNAAVVGYDIFLHYDYGVLKWLGVGTGVGYSSRGGRAGDPYFSDGERQLSYLNIPVRLQFKPMYYLWIEAGVEMLYFVNYKDEGNFGDPGVSNRPFDADGINNLTISFVPAVRLNLFKGLSIVGGYSMGLTNAAQVKIDQPQSMSTSYKNYSVFLGMRYMIGQPEE